MNGADTQVESGIERLARPRLVAMKTAQRPHVPQGPYCLEDAALRPAFLSHDTKPRSNNVRGGEGAWCSPAGALQRCPPHWPCVPQHSWGEVGAPK